jgi:hypothetical protein
LAWTREGSEADPNIEVILEIMDEPSFVIQKADEAARLLIVRGDHELGIGDWILFFLELEALLGTFFAMDCVVKENPGFTQKLIAGMLGRRDPIFLRSFLLHAILVIGTMRGAANPLFDRLDEIGHPINRQIVQAFRNLSTWFGFKMETFAASIQDNAPPR